ncbi:restriction endonuclease subunit S [Streptomyces anthocyanicus]
MKTDHWRNVPLWSIATETREAVDPSNLGDQVVHYSIPAVDAIGTGQVEATDSIESAKLRLQGGEVLISKLNPRKSRVVIVTDSPLPIVSSTEFVGILPGTTLEPRFLAYFLQAESTRQVLDSQVQSVTRSHQRVAPEVIMHLPVRLPSLEEQRHIADFLEIETARIDRLISLRQKQVALLNERIYSLVSETLQPTKVDATDRRLVKVGHVCRLYPGISPSSLPKEDHTFVVRPYLQISNVQSGTLHLDNVALVRLPKSQAARAKLQKGDVLTTRVGDPDKLGRAAVWNEEIDDCLFESNIFALRPDASVLVPEYLALLTRTAYGRHYFESTGSKTTGLASTNTGKILGFRIPLPDVKTQCQLVERVHEALVATGRIHDALTQQSAVLRERRRALITAAATGQFDVSTTSGCNVTEGVSA